MQAINYLNQLKNDNHVFLDQILTNLFNLDYNLVDLHHFAGSLAFTNLDIKTKIISKLTLVA